MSGAFSLKESTGGSDDTDGIGPSLASFDAALCSPVYGASNTVMPPSIDVPHAIYLGVTV